MVKPINVDEAVEAMEEVKQEVPKSKASDDAESKKSPQKEEVMVAETSDGKVTRDAMEVPHITSIIYGTWNIMYSWPKQTDLPDLAREIIFGPPSKLENALFSCKKCMKKYEDVMGPIKSYSQADEILVCELVNEESQVEVAINRPSCECKVTPRSDKFVALPLNEKALLYLRYFPNVEYTKEDPYTVLLLHREIASVKDVHAWAEKLEILKSRKGGLAFHYNPQD